MLAFALAFVVTPNYNGYVRQQRPLPISATAVGRDPVGAGQRVGRLLWTSSMTSYLPADGQDPDGARLGSLIRRCRI